MANHLRDISGQRFGKLVVIAHERTGREAMWRVRCDCGGEMVARGTRLREGTTVDCGCGVHDRRSNSTKRHGMTETRTWRVWKGMLSRATNQNDKDWMRYGGRGITVCDEWRTFEGFFASMGECPPNLTLERVDVNGNYCPENCVWATQKQQQRNRRNNRRVEYRGRLVPLSQACEEAGAGVDWHKARNRMLKCGWSVQRAVEVP